MSPFAKKVWIVVGIASLTGILVLLAEATIHILLLVFAGIVLAVYLRGLANLLASRTPLGPRLALACVVLVHLMVLAALVVYAVPVLDAQIAELSEKLPAAIERLEDWLRSHTWGRWLLAQAPDPSSIAQSDGGGWVSRITGVFSATMSAVVGLFIILFVGLYGAAEPDVYRRGLLHLFPEERRDRVNEILRRMVRTLRWWLVGRVVSAAIVGVLTALGLWIIGVPLAFLMGIIAGALTFIPNVGPTIAVVPPALLALLNSPQDALIVVIYYVGVQLVESYVITPMIERRAIHVPPALLLTVQALFAVLTGVVGLAMADPLLAVILVLVQALHVEDVIGEPAAEST